MKAFIDAGARSQFLFALRFVVYVCNYIVLRSSASLLIAVVCSKFQYLLILCVPVSIFIETGGVVVIVVNPDACHSSAVSAA